MQKTRYSLTPVRLAILEFVRRYQEEHGQLPSVEDIGAAIGLKSTGTVHYHLRALTQAGYLAEASSRKTGGRTPALAIPWAEQANTIPVPLIGTIRADKPAPLPRPESWAMHPETIIPAPACLAKGEQNLFALRSEGSFPDAFVHDGDLLLLQHARTVEDGQMAAVWLRDRQETWLRKVYYGGKQIKLQALCPPKASLHNPEDVDVRARLVALLRNF